MEYTVRSLSADFGKGVKISKDDRSYEQFACNDGLTARIYNTQGNVVDKDFHGIIFRPPFKPTEKGYNQFKVLTDRVNNASGDEIPNSLSHFMDYACHTGLDKQLSGISARVRVNPKDRKDFPDNMQSWVNRKAHWAGLASDLAVYALGLWSLSFDDYTSMVDGKEVNNAAKAYVACTLLGGFIEGIGGIIATDCFGAWCGPAHALGFVPVRRFLKGKLREPDYILGKFLQDYKGLEYMAATGDGKGYARQSKKADMHYKILEDLFRFTENQQGFSISYDSLDRKDVMNFFGYVLGTGSSYVVRGMKPKVEINETKPAETNFIDPWDADIPKLGGGKR
ncbi:MAG: hypothetical protein ABIH63_00570 [archaeon]